MPENEAKSVETQILPWVWGIGALIALVGAAWCANGRDSAWTLALFSLPVIAELIGCAILWHRLNVNSHRSNVAYYRLNLSSTGACVLSYCLLWAAYHYVVGLDTSQKHPEILQGFSILALILIGLLLLVVGIMTAAFVMASSSKPTARLGHICEDLRNGIKAEPLWAIAQFFVLFLGVSFLFGFALAYHDQYALTLDAAKPIEDRRPALRMVNLKSIDDAEETPQSKDRQKGSRSDTGTLDVSGQDPYFFYFDDGRARLQTKPYNKCNPQTPPDRVDNKARKPEEFNDCSLTALLKRIEDDTKDNKRIRIFLIGHTSNEPIGKGTETQSYFSNYELSEARAENVRFRILQRFGDTKWRNVEWSILPGSSERLPEVTRGLVNREWFTAEELRSKFKDKDPDSLTQEDFEKSFSTDEIFEKVTAKLDKDRVSQELRLVAAIVKPISDHVSTLQMTQIHQSQHKTLTLMDYMYFSIYTITTTGYGDIVPTTAYAKFVTSLANICEVLFLVVFFNALISIKGEKPDRIEEVLDLLRTRNTENDTEAENSNNVRRFGGRTPE
jgi:hypothetical protein